MHINFYFHVVNDEAVKTFGNSGKEMCFPFFKEAETIPLLSKLTVTMSFRVLEHALAAFNAIILLS